MPRTWKMALQFRVAGFKCRTMEADDILTEMPLFYGKGLWHPRGFTSGVSEMLLRRFASLHVAGGGGGGGTEREEPPFCEPGASPSVHTQKEHLSQ